MPVDPFAPQPSQGADDCDVSDLRAELFDQLRDAGLDPKRSGEQIGHLCPVHEANGSHKPSASSTVKVNEKTGQLDLFVYCHAGCDFTEVGRAFRATGITMRSLRVGCEQQGRRGVTHHVEAGPEWVAPAVSEEQVAAWQHAFRGSGMARRLAEKKGWSMMTTALVGIGFDGERATIPFRDLDGNLLGAERYEPDTPDSARKMLAAKGAKRHLWIPPGGLRRKSDVIVCEGPTDAITAFGRGLNAVGAPSANIWNDRHVEPLLVAGVRSALIVYDCDRAGRDGAPRVAESLRGRGIDVTVADLDPSRQHKEEDKYDVSDWLLERPDRDAAELLDELRSHAQPWQNDSLSATPGDHRFELVAPNLGDVRAIEWAWSARIVIGLFNLLVGEEGAGKGSLAAWIIARLTKGELDGDLHGVPSRVIIGGDEDDFDRVWTPRLHVAGADLALLRQVRGQSGESLTFPSGIATLRALVEDFGARFVFFDALLDNLDPDVNPDRAKHVRSALMPLRALARDLDVAIVGAVHTNKTRGNFRQSISGSHQFNGVSKSSLIVAKHPEGPEERRVVASGKGNYSRRPTSLEFKIEGRSPRIGGVEIKTSVAVDFVSSPLTADDLSAAAKPEATSKAAQAREYIAQQLDDHEPHDAGPIIAHLKDMLGLDDRAIRKAREAVGAVSEAKPEYQGGHAWRLPRPHEQFTRLGRDGRDGDARMSANAVRADSSRDTE
jgi:hypothetical protein